MAFRVPTPNVSVVDLTVRLEKPVSDHKSFYFSFIWIYYYYPYYYHQGLRWNLLIKLICKTVQFLRFYSLSTSTLWALIFCYIPWSIW